VRVEIDAADERGLPFAACIDHPGFLMLAKSGMCAIPANFHARSATIEQCPVLGRSPERVTGVPCSNDVGTPEDDSDVDPS